LLQYVNQRLTMNKNSFKKNNELIEAALDEFSSHSYENASLNKIIKNAGISKGLFYYHFEDKKALYSSILETAAETQVEFINKNMNEQDLIDKDIFENLKLQFQISGKFAAANPKYYKFITMFFKENQNEINNDLKSAVESSNNLLLDHLVNNAIKKGDFSKRFSNDFIAKIMQYLFTNYFEIFNKEEDYELENILKNAKNFIDFLKYGLGK
jgi:TetR/AcrR family transcriptional regulator